jgi:hypothetical protein
LPVAKSRGGDPRGGRSGARPGEEHDAGRERRRRPGRRRGATVPGMLRAREEEVEMKKQMREMFSFCI